MAAIRNEAAQFAAPTVRGRDMESGIHREADRIEVPVALALATLVVVAVAVFEPATPRVELSHITLGTVTLCVVLLSIAAATRWTRVGRHAASWMYASASVLVTAWLLQMFVDSPANAHTGYLVIIVIALGPLILEWVPFLIACSLVSGGTIALALTNPWRDPASWITIMLVASCTSAVLMLLRRRSISALSRARGEAEQQAMTDSLTGLLNRSGLDAMLPGLIDTAIRLGQPLVVTFLDVDGLKKANDVHGHEFGDTVLRTVATAIRSSVRKGDLVVRWGGDEFLVVGLGIAPGDREFARRIEDRILASGINLRRWSGHVSMGSAHAMPHAVSVEHLISLADRRLCESRHARQSLSDSIVSAPDERIEGSALN